MKTVSLWAALCLLLCANISFSQNPCSNAATIQCGQTISGNMNNAQNSLSSYNCTDLNYDGKERIYKLVIPDDGRVAISNPQFDIKLSGLQSDLDLLVLKDGCTAENCVGASTNGGNTDEMLTLDEKPGTYYIIVEDYGNSADNSFQLSTDCACVGDKDSNCNAVFFHYVGTNGDLAYRFAIPDDYPSDGYWTGALENEAFTPVIGQGTLIDYTFPTNDVYEVCYNYVDENGCDAACCKTISSYDPTSCIELLTEDQGDRMRIYAPTDRFVRYWRDNNTLATIATATNSISIPKPAEGECRQISAYFYDEPTNCYQVCIIDICGEATCPPLVDEDCDDLSFSYTGSNGSLRYYFITNNPQAGGYWSSSQLDIDPNDPEPFSDVRLGSTEGIYYTFPKEGSYQVCYIYIDENGCEVVCSKNIYVQDPLNCGLISKVLDTDTNECKLSWADDENGNTAPIRWANVTTGQPLGSTTRNITVDAPASGTCVTIEAQYFDVICARYGVCQIELCTEDTNTNCCVDKLEDLAWLNTLKTEIERTCNDPAGSASIQRGQLNGACVYIAENFLLDDLLTVLFDCQGNLICQQNPLFNETCSQLAQVTAKTTIWECPPNYEFCASTAAGTITCDGNIYDYKFTLTNHTNEMLRAQFIVAFAGVSFVDCNNVEEYLAAPGTNEVMLSFENCFGTISPNTDVFLAAQYFDTNDKICHVESIEITLNCNSDEEEEALCVGGENLLKNGDFEGGNWAFESELSQDCWCKDDSYCITTNTQNKCAATDPFTMDNKFLVVQKATDVDYTVWRQEVAVKSGQKYVFAFDMQAFEDAATLVLIAGDKIIGSVQSNGTTRTSVGKNWTSPVTAEIPISIVSMEGSNGNLGIDNVYFGECSPISPSPTMETRTSAPKQGDDSLSNYPNPFSEHTTLQFSLAEAGEVQLYIRDTNGRIVYERTQHFSAGQHAIPFRAEQLVSGVYSYTIQTATWQSSRLMLLTRK